MASRATRSILSDAPRHSSARGRTRGAPCFWLRIAAAVLLAGLVGLPAGVRPSAAASPPALTVGVVDFYSPGYVPALVGVFPEQFAADDLSAALAKAGPMSLVPRSVMRQAEAALRWRAADALSFSRLADLAQRAHADRLVVGWLQHFAVGPDNGGDVGIPSGGPFMGTATVVVQVFDPAQGRLVWQTTGNGWSQGLILRLVVQDVLHQAIAPTVPRVVSELTGGGT